jgi:RNA polymerase sigma-70 factor (ECF subfamily)
MAPRTNTEWLTDLQGPEKNQAIAELRRVLIRGLTYALSNRVNAADLNALVEDFVQDSLLRILDKLDTFRGESLFTTWAQKIAIRVAYTELRRQRWKDISLQDLLPEDSFDFTPMVLADPSPDPEERASQTMMAEMVQKMIDEDLTDRQRTAMMAIMVGGMPLEEVAQRMDTNRNALYKLIHDARKRMKQSLLARGMTPQEVLAAFEGE